MQTTPRSRVVRLAAPIVLASLLAAAASSTGRAQDRPAYVLGVSSMLVGNGWNEALICSIKAQAAASGKVARVIVANRRGGPAEQNADISALVSAGVDAIIVNPSSAVALNNAIEAASAEGVEVVAVDQRVTAPSAYNATNDQVAYGRAGAEWLFRQLRGKGNVVELRGIKGTQVDTDRHAGFVEARKRYPGITVVRSVHMNWDWALAGQTMLDILNSGVKVDGVWTSGIDYTVTNAFVTAGRALVPIVGADTNGFLRQQLETKGWRSAAVTNPATIGAVGTSMAIRLLGGVKVPKWVKLAPEVWDSGTAAGRAKIKANYSASRPVTYSARLQIKPWTTYSTRQLHRCNSVG